MVECRAIHPVVQVRILTRPLGLGSLKNPKGGECYDRRRVNLTTQVNNNQINPIQKGGVCMGNSLKRTVRPSGANGLLATAVKHSVRLANGLMATGAISFLVSLF